MIAVTLSLAFVGSLGLAASMIGQGEFVEATKALVTAGGLFALLSLKVTLYRASHGR